MSTSSGSSGSPDGERASPVDRAPPTRETLPTERRAYRRTGDDAVARERGGFWIGLCAVFFYPVGWLSARPRFVGLEHIPRTGGVVVVANHISHIDPIYSALAVHLARRVPRFLAKDSLWRVPVLGTVLRATGQIPVFRGTADAKAQPPGGHGRAGGRQGR